MLVVETILKIRRLSRVQGKTIKAICRELGVSRKVVRKVLRSDEISSLRRTFRTTFRDTPNSRQIALIVLPCTRESRRIFRIVSTTSIQIKSLR